MFYQHANDNDHTTGINTFLWSHSLLWKLRWRTKLDGSKIQSCIWSCQWPCLKVGSWRATLSHQTVLSQSVDLKLYYFTCHSQSYSSVWAWRATLSISPYSSVLKCGLEEPYYLSHQTVLSKSVGLKSHYFTCHSQLYSNMWAWRAIQSISPDSFVPKCGLEVILFHCHSQLYSNMWAWRAPLFILPIMSQSVGLKSYHLPHLSPSIMPENVGLVPYCILSSPLDQVPKYGFEELYYLISPADHIQKHSFQLFKSHADLTCWSCPQMWL